MNKKILVIASITAVLILSVTVILFYSFNKNKPSGTPSDEIAPENSIKDDSAVPNLKFKEGASQPGSIKSGGMEDLKK